MHIPLTPLFLVPAEIEILTGFKTPGRQITWLSGKGWRFEKSGSGRPIVARGYAEKMLGCGPQEVTVPRPNFNALRAA